MPTLSSRRLTPTDGGSDGGEDFSGAHGYCHWQYCSCRRRFAAIMKDWYAFAKLRSTGSTNNDPFTFSLKSQTKAPRPVTACHESWDEPPLPSRALSYPAGFLFRCCFGRVRCVACATLATQAEGGRVRPAAYLTSPPFAPRRGPPSLGEEVRRHPSIVREGDKRLATAHKCEQLGGLSSPL
jgi:hypothetical protein